MPTATLVDTARTTLNRKPVRYAMVSAFAVPFSQVILIVCAKVIGLPNTVSNVIAVSISCIPSYLLNRAWVWGKRGRNHFWKEVAPFWGMALLGLVLSTLFVAYVDGHTEAVWAASLASLSAFGLLWVGKYFVLNSLLFGASEEIDTSIV